MLKEVVNLGLILDLFNKKEVVSMDLLSVLYRMLIGGYGHLQRMIDGEVVIKEGGAFGDANNDTELAADKRMGTYYASLASASGLFGSVTVEGSSPITCSNEEGYDLCTDPIDGSLDYKLRGLSIGLPFSTVMTVFRAREDGVHKIKDVVGGGVIDLRCGDMWLWTQGRGETLFFPRGIDGGHVVRPYKGILDIGTSIVIGEFYYPENRGLLCEIFGGQKGWLRNPGSAGYEMALVSSGQVTAFVCDRQKHHELGAAYALIKGAGGLAVDFEGNDIGGFDFRFNGGQSPVILAANQGVADELLKRISKARGK